MAKPSNFVRDKCPCIAYIGAVLLFCFWSFSDPSPSSSILNCKPIENFTQEAQTLNTSKESLHKTFYDNPKVHYTIDKPLSNWDSKRLEWLMHHPTFASGIGSRVLVISGSQPSQCKNPLGDHLLLRFFKNKVDYCRIHGYKIFYSNVFLEPNMRSYWAKIPLVRASMIAHPEVEWILWVDSDAIFTDMDFKIPFERYKDHNLVVHGWPHSIYIERSWVSVNAGIFLMRNCQWSIDFLGVWANMGPKSPMYKKWGKILKSTLPDKMFPESDDQSALVYLLLKEKRKWGEKIYVENEYSLHGYWVGIVGKFNQIAEKYKAMEKKVKSLMRRHAEGVSESYGVEMETEHRRPFITHFTGCQPCSGDHNPAYEGDSCRVGMEQALNFADNQVLRNYGFVHHDLRNGSLVEPLSFNFQVGSE